MISFAKDHSDALWCYGNHDVSYLWRRLETGYSPYAERTVISRLEELFEFSTYRDETQIGESAMVVIDSVTGKCEKIEVPGKKD